MDLCHEGMVRPQILGGGDGLRVWKVEVNIQ